MGSPMKRHTWDEVWNILKDPKCRSLCPCGVREHHPLGTWMSSSPFGHLSCVQLSRSFQTLSSWVFIWGICCIGLTEAWVTMEMWLDKRGSKPSKSCVFRFFLASLCSLPSSRYGTKPSLEWGSYDPQNPVMGRGKKSRRRCERGILFIVTRAMRVMNKELWMKTYVCVSMTCHSHTFIQLFSTYVLNTIMLCYYLCLNSKFFHKNYKKQDKSILYLPVCLPFLVLIL